MCLRLCMCVCVCVRVYNGNDLVQKVGVVKNRRCHLSLFFIPAFAHPRLFLIPVCGTNDRPAVP